MTGLLLLIGCMAFGWAVCYIILNFVVDAIDSRKARTEARAEEQAWVRRNLYNKAEVRLKLAKAELTRAAADEAVLLGPVSAWVAEGEARAVREWERKRPDPNAEPPADISDIRMTTIR
jgi:hypothetical protein